MYQNERLEKIMEILHQYRYVTVKYLTYHLDYSTATINRDLNLLESKQLIKRSYGGVELMDNKSAPLLVRYANMAKKKNSIAQQAASLIQDGDTVFINGSTTTEAMGKYLVEKKNITVITNNMALALFLNEHNIDVIQLGGRIVEPPYILGGTQTEENAMKYRANKMFFSSSGMTANGEIKADAIYETLHRIMHTHSTESYYLVDSEKIVDSVQKVLFTPMEVSGIISDYHIPEHIQARFPDTQFMEVTY